MKKLPFLQEGDDRLSASSANEQLGQPSPATTSSFLFLISFFADVAFMDEQRQERSASTSTYVSVLVHSLDAKYGRTKLRETIRTSYIAGVPAMH